MQLLEGEFKNSRSYNAIRLGERMFLFAREGGKIGAPPPTNLLVIELILGEKLTTKRINTGVDTRITGDYWPGCCRVGNKALVMYGIQHTRNVFAAFVSVDPGELTRESIHVERLEVSGLGKWGGNMFLGQIGKNRVWGSFLNSNEVWLCEIKENVLQWTNSSNELPTAGGFGAPPLYLPKGKLLVAGTWPESTDIYIITPGNKFSFKKVGNFPEEGRFEVSLALFKDRFVFGFGGYLCDTTVSTLWIFDLETHKSSVIIQQGNWHPGAHSSILEIQNDTLYVIGGVGRTCAYSLRLADLAILIRDEAVRIPFSDCLKESHPPSFQRSFRPRNTPASRPSLQPTYTLSTAGQEFAAPTPELAQSDSKQLQRDSCGPRLAPEAVSQQNLRPASISTHSKTKKSQKDAPMVQPKEELKDAEKKVCVMTPIASPREGENHHREVAFKRVNQPPGSILIRVSFGSLPTFPHYSRWKLNSSELEKLQKAMRAARQGFERDHVEEFNNVFFPFTNRELPHKLVSFQGSVPTSTVWITMAFIVSCISSTRLLVPERADLLTLANLHSLRLERRLLDSKIFRKSLVISIHSMKQSTWTRERTPPTYDRVIKLLEASDPMRTDSIHQSTCILRRILHFVTTQKEDCLFKTLAEAIQYFQWLSNVLWRGAVKAGFFSPVPWMDPQEKPQSHSQPRSEARQQEPSRGSQVSRQSSSSNRRRGPAEPPRRLGEESSERLEGTQEGQEVM